MDLSIIIVSWNVKEKLRECLRSVEETAGLPENYRHPERSEEPALSLPKGSRATQESRDSSPAAQNDKLFGYEVFVVDNASKDGTVAMVEREFPWVYVIANDFNAGFAKANNQAIRLSQGRYVLFLNPDMRLLGGFSPPSGGAPPLGGEPRDGGLQGMVKFMDEERNARVGVAGCHLVSPTPPNLPSGRGGSESLVSPTPPLPPLLTSPRAGEEIASGRGGSESVSPPFEGGVRGGFVTVPQVRRFPTLKDQLAIMLKVPHLFPRVIDQYQMRDFDYSKEARVDSIRGSFFMIRRELLDKIGLLDEGFFIWFEEVDFCKRTIDAGYEVSYTPSVKCVDYVGQSFKQIRLYQKQKMFTKSMLYYFKKHRPWWEAELLDWLRPVALAAVWVGDKLNIQAKRVT